MTTPNLKLVRLQIENFKSLKSIDIPFGDSISVLIGKNNVGKSSILDVFEFVKEGARGAQAAVTTRAETLFQLTSFGYPPKECKLHFTFGVPDVLREELLRAFEAQRPGQARFSIAELAESGFLRTLDHSIVIGNSFCETTWTRSPTGESHLTLITHFSKPKEEMSIQSLPWNLVWLLEKESKPNLSLMASGWHYAPGNPPHFLYGHRPEIGAGITQCLRSFFESLYHVNPNRKPTAAQGVGEVDRIDADGTNLVQVLHTLHNNKKLIFNKIEANLKALVDGVDSVSTPISAATTTIRIFQDLGLESPQPFTLKQVSSGTQQILILLTQLTIQPVNTLFLIEEMENLLHPAAQRELFSILRDFANKLTIVLSTHSPVIASEARQHSLFLVKKVRGFSTAIQFSEAIAQEVVEEMGIRPSYAFESDRVTFVEGKFDERVFRVWLDEAKICRNLKLIESGGFGNVQFYTNSKLLRERVVQIKPFAILDGDVKDNEKFERIKTELRIPDTSLHILGAPNLEALLADPTGICRAFPQIRKSPEEVAEMIDERRGKDLKATLGIILRDVGGYTVENAAGLARQIAPPAGLLAFFKRIDSE